MFSPIERMMAWRYLRARKAEGFVSVIAGFSFLGIMLGVATLIIVMSVMNGFRAELVDRILGLNGHLNVYSLSGPLFIFMDLNSAKVFFQRQGRVNSLEVMADSPAVADKIKGDLQVAVGDRAQIYDWRNANSSFLNALAVERNVMFLILTLIILVAAFNIISSMIMLVKDKGKDIAILRTMGATQKNMLNIFVLTGASIGFAGTLAGAIIGVVFASNIETLREFLENVSGTELFADEVYFLSQLPAIIQWQDITTVIVMALVLSIGATLYPAWRASRLDPVEALRYE